MPPHHRSADHYEVGRESIRQFARAIQEFHPAHWDEHAAHALGHPGLVAPVTFACSTGTLAQRALLRDALAGYEPSRLLYVEQEIQVHRPVVAGDRLLWDVAVDSVRPADDADLIAVTVVVRDQDTGPVQTVHTTLLHRPAAETGNIAEALAMQDIPSPSFSGIHTSPPTRHSPHGPPAPSYGLAPGQQLPPRTYRLSRGDLVHYAGVSGDNNPIHWNDSVAHAAGLNDVVAHGMLTMGIGSSYLTSSFDNPCWAVEYTVQFDSPVYVGSRLPAQLTFAGNVRTVDERRGTIAVALTAHADGRPVFRRATATIRAATADHASKRFTR